MNGIPMIADRAIQPRTAGRPALRPLALPTEHGGWGILLEPIVLALAIAPSLAGLLVAFAFLFAFLARHPFKLALQDAMRGASYPRTSWCRAFALAYGSTALVALALAIATSGWTLLVPIALVAPLGLVQILYDANRRSRALLPELAGAAAMASSAAAIAIAGGVTTLPALALSGIVIARSIPSIVYVRTLLQRAHGKTAPSWPPLALHTLAIASVALIGPRLAALAITLLLARAAWGLTHPVPRAKTIGWSEVGWGALTVVLVVVGSR